MKITRLFLILVLLIVLLAVAAPAFAEDPPVTPGANASPSGQTHGAFASVNGNFGFLGDVGGTPGYHNGAVGQEPGATGYNNCHVMGQCP